MISFFLIIVIIIQLTKVFYFFVFNLVKYQDYLFQNEVIN